MLALPIESIFDAAERRTILSVLRSHPAWTLEDLATLIEQDGARARLLSTLTVGELVESPGLATITHPDDGGPAIDRRRLELARTLTGQAFDDVVLRVLDEAGGCEVGASYLRARVGGPRWKLQQSMRRLVRAGLVDRNGTTSATRYRAAVVVVGDAE